MVEDSDEEESDQGESGGEEQRGKISSAVSAAQQKRGVSAAKSISAGHAPLDEAVIGSIKGKLYCTSDKHTNSLPFTQSKSIQYKSIRFCHLLA